MLSIGQPIILLETKKLAIFLGVNTHPKNKFGSTTILTSTGVIKNINSFDKEYTEKDRKWTYTYLIHRDGRPFIGVNNYGYLGRFKSLPKENKEYFVQYLKSVQSLLDEKEISYNLK